MTDFFLFLACERNMAHCSLELVWDPSTIHVQLWEKRATFFILINCFRTRFLMYKDEERSQLCLKDNLPFSNVSHFWVLTETFHYFGDLLCQKSCLVLLFAFNWICQHMPRDRTKYCNLYWNTVLCCSTHEIDVRKKCTVGMENTNKYCDPFTFSFK